VPAGYTQRIEAKSGSSQVWRMIDPQGRPMPITYVNHDGGKIHGYVLDGSDQLLPSWSVLRAVWPSYARTRARLAAARRGLDVFHATKPALPMVVIYDRPRDLPGGFAVRQWAVSPGVVAPVKLLGSDLLSLEAARELVPAGLVNIGRAPDDDPKIVEVWT
jgi:hypothetical protein